MKKNIWTVCFSFLSATMLLGCVMAPPVHPQRNWDCAGAKAEYSRLLVGYEKAREEQAEQLKKARENAAPDLGAEIGKGIALALLGVPYNPAATQTKYIESSHESKFKLLAVWKDMKRVCNS